MTVVHTPTPARSDLAPATVPTSTADRPFRLHGRVLSVGALLWAAGIFAYTPNPTGTVPLVLFGVASGAFQVGLLFLLRVLRRTRALGDGRIARAALRAQTAAVSLAIVSTFVDSIQLSDLSQPGWFLLDMFWPLSMMGMFLIGIRIAVAGRWKGVTRFWPLVAESWAVVVIPTMGIVGGSVANAVAGLHLVVGYAVLGVLVSRKSS